MLYKNDLETTFYVLGAAGFIAEKIRLAQLKFFHNSLSLDINPSELKVAGIFSAALTLVPLIGWSVAQSHQTLQYCYMFQVSLYCILAIITTTKLIRMRQVLISNRIYPGKNLDDLVVVFLRVLSYSGLFVGVVTGLEQYVKDAFKLSIITPMFISISSDFILPQNRYLLCI